MKKLILIAFSALVFMLSSTVPALADSLAFNYKANFTEPGKPDVSAQTRFDFKGTKRIIFETAGKTCDLLGSASPIGASQGCNYDIDIAANGRLTGTGNAPCTQNVADACK